VIFVVVLLCVVSLHYRHCLIMRDAISSVGYDCCFIVGLCFFMQLG
jgi:hypothetical protein